MVLILAPLKIYGYHDIIIYELSYRGLNTFNIISLLIIILFLVFNFNKLDRKLYLNLYLSVKGGPREHCSLKKLCWQKVFKNIDTFTIILLELD